MGEILVVILFIVFLVSHSRLKARVEALEAKLSGKPAPTQTPETAPKVQHVPPPTQAPRPQGPGAAERLFKWFAEDWLLKLGGLILILGFAWLTSYAFLNNWIGPVGRITLGIVGGLAFIVLGWWRLQSQIHQGSLFGVIGSTIVLITVFAARELYGFFTPTTALAVMFISTVFVALLAVKYRVQYLALLSIISASIAPFLTKSPDPSFITLFWYLAVIVVGTLWIVAITKWRALTFASLLVVVAYSLQHVFDGFRETPQLLPFAFAFGALFYIFNTLSMIKAPSASEMKSDLVTAMVNGILLLLWITQVVPDHWQSLTTIAWMLVFVVGAFVMFRATNIHAPFYVYGALGVVYIAAATAMELSGPALTIAYTVEAGVISWLTHTLTKDKISTNIATLLMGIPIVLSIPSIDSRAWRTDVFHEDFFVLAVLTAVLFLLATLYHKKSEGVTDDSKMDLSAMLAVIGSIYLYIIIWLSLHASMVNDTATMVALVIYTIIGLAAYIQGRVHFRKVLRYYGGALLLFVVGRLLLIEVWQMALTGRIITFFLIGLLLMSTAFIGRGEKQVTDN